MRLIKTGFFAVSKNKTAMAEVHLPLVRRDEKLWWKILATVSSSDAHHPGVRDITV